MAESEDELTAATRALGVWLLSPALSFLSRSMVALTSASVSSISSGSSHSDVCGSLSPSSHSVRRAVNLLRSVLLGDALGPMSVGT